MSYLIDVYRREVPAQKDVYKLALYIVLFPQLVAGPIVKYHDVCEQIDNRTIEFKNVIIGFKRFITGLAKKVLIANTLAEVVDKIFAQAPENLTTGVSWLGAVAYCLQLYYDFSGYSDMAIGLGLMFGFRFWKTLIILTFPSQLPNFGGGGIFRWQHGLSSICISRWAATAKGRFALTGTCLRCFW